MPHRCSSCGELGHHNSRHRAASRSLVAGRLVYEDGLSFAEAGRIVGISRQAAHQGWRKFVAGQSKP